MPKIKCPHCGATNQDVTSDDPCWQCGTVLSAPVSALDTGSGPPTSAAHADKPTPSAPIPTTVQVQVTRPEPAPSPTKQTVPETRPNRQIGVVLAVVVVLLLLLVVFYLLRHH